MCFATGNNNFLICVGVTQMFEVTVAFALWQRLLFLSASFLLIFIGEKPTLVESE